MFVCRGTIPAVLCMCESCLLSTLTEHVPGLFSFPEWLSTHKPTESGPFNTLKLSSLFLCPCSVSWFWLTQPATTQDCNDLICLCVHREETRPSKWYVFHCFLQNNDQQKSEKPESDLGLTVTGILWVEIIETQFPYSGETDMLTWHLRYIQSGGHEEKMESKDSISTNLYLSKNITKG